MSDESLNSIIDTFQAARVAHAEVAARYAELQAEASRIQEEASRAEGELRATLARHQQELVNVQRVVDDRHGALAEVEGRITTAYVELGRASDAESVARGKLRAEVNV